MFGKYALVVAGGTGSRMGTAIPKQFLPVKGKPILMHTLSAFYHANNKIKIILVLPGEERMNWGSLCSQHSFGIPHISVSGGQTRQESVINGLGLIEEADSLVAIHDGVRPFTDPSIINKAYEVAELKGNACVAVQSKDSVRVLDAGENWMSVNRDAIRMMQTPQTFRAGLIKEAYRKVKDPGLTDDASIAEAAGVTIHLVEGNYSNIKVTTPEDLLFAEVLASKYSRLA